MSVIDYQAKCKKQLHAHSYNYFASGADDEITLANNLLTFAKIYLAPRVLIDIASVSLQTKILGFELSLPFGNAPLAMQKLIHKDGELLSARQAYDRRTAYGLSMLSTTSIHHIKAVNPTGLKILQLYFLKNAEYTKDIVAYAERQGFHALAVTVDTQIFGKRRANIRDKFNPDVTLEIFKDLGLDIHFTHNDQSKQFTSCLDTQVTWQRIKELRSLTKLKIILKGVVNELDVQLAQNCGVDAIWVSNHGGRQLDTAPATIVALPVIRNRIKEIGSKMEVYVDGGVRTGSDIFKCLALGADFVFLGRGFIFSLIDGQQGISNMYDTLQKQLTTTMMLCGVTKIGQINSEYIIRAPQATL